MKKFLLALIIILIVGVYWFIPKATVEQPLIVTAQLDSTSNTIDISYIVNKNNPTFIESFTYGAYHFYSTEVNESLATNDYETNVFATQNGLELRELQVNLTEEQMQVFQQEGVYVFMTEFTFEAYEPITEAIIYMPKEIAKTQAGDDETITHTYVADVEETIEIIGHYEKQSTISFEQDGKMANLPVNLLPGDELSISIHSPYQLSTHHKMLIEIVKGNGEIITKSIELKKKMPKGYLKQLVEQHQEGI